MSNMQDNLAFCQTELKKTNPVRHFSALTAAEEHRSAFISFQTFLADIARIPRVVTDPSMGEIRLQWWRDIILSPTEGGETELRGSSTGPLATALQNTQQRYGLSPDTLIQIIDARTFDLYNDPMPDLDTYEAYAGETQSLATMLSAQILNGGEQPTDLSDLCGHAGMAISLANHLFDWPKAATVQKLFLPYAIFEQEGANKADIFGLNASLGLETAIKSLVQLGHEHRIKAMAEFRALKNEKRAHLAPAFLPLAHANLMLNKRSKHPLADLSLANWRAYLSLWRMAASS